MGDLLRVPCGCPSADETTGSYVVAKVISAAIRFTNRGMFFPSRHGLADSAALNRPPPRRGLNVRTDPLELSPGVKQQAYARQFAALGHEAWRRHLRPSYRIDFEGRSRPPVPLTKSTRRPGRRTRKYLTGVPVEPCRALPYPSSCEWQGRVSAAAASVRQSSGRRVTAKPRATRLGGGSFIHSTGVETRPIQMSGFNTSVTTSRLL